MKTLTILLGAVILASCAAAKPDVKAQAIEDFVAVAELEEVDRIRYGSKLAHEKLTLRHLIMSTRKQDYLVKLVRSCWELDDNTRVTPDYRQEANVIWSRSDTIRGCRIGAIYSINPGQAEELRSIGDAPAGELEAPPPPETAN